MSDKIYTDRRVELNTPEAWLDMMTHCSGCGKELVKEEPVKHFDFMFPEQNLLMGYMCKVCCEKTMAGRQPQVHTAYVLRPEWAEYESIPTKADQMLMEYWEKKG
jgi:hypothetical protein